MMTPRLSGLSSCSSIVVIKGSRVYAIVWYFVHAVSLMCFGTLVAVMDVTTAEDNVIPMTALSHMGGGVNRSALGGCYRCRSGRGLGLCQ